MNSQKVLIIGGTGYLGYHICHELVKKGYLVTALSIDDVPTDFLPPQVTVQKADIHTLSDFQLEQIFKGHDYFIFAAGADDRLIPKKPAFNFFYKANVESVVRLISIAKTAGVKKNIILNSYFAYFNRIWPEMHLADKHPYVRSRKLQQQKAFEAAGSNMPTAIIELPYIVGVTPTKGSLWAGLIKYVNSPGKYKFYTKGGTAVVSVRNVGVAIANALELTTQNSMFQVVDVNLTWAEWLSALKQDSNKQIKVIYIPNILVKFAAYILKLVQTLKGEESGLNVPDFVDLQTKNTFLPIQGSKERLHYGKYSIQEDFRDTIELCMNANSNTKQ